MSAVSPALLMGAVVGLLLLATVAPAASLNGLVKGGGAPIAGSSVTLWSAGTGQPMRVAEARSGADGRFAITAPGTVAPGASLYLVARGGQPTANRASGDNPHIALITVLGPGPRQL